MQWDDLATLVILSNGDVACRQFVECDHLMQIFQQATVMYASPAFYVVASEIGILFSLFTRVQSTQKTSCLFALSWIAFTVLSWAHLMN